MALYHSPSIVYDELVLHIDASNPKSYPGSGTTIKNMANNSKNGSMVNGVTVSSIGTTKTFSFDGTNDYINFGTGNTFFPILPMSIDVWFRCIGTTPTTGTHPGIFGLTYSLSLYINNLGNLVYWDSYPTALISSGYNYVDSKWHNVIVQTNGATSNMFIDGIFQKTAASTWNGSGAYPNNVFRLGMEVNNSFLFFTGNISTFKIYNKFLSASEIQQNFNALRGRYGI